MRPKLTVLPLSADGDDRRHLRPPLCPCHSCCGTSLAGFPQRAFLLPARVPPALLPDTSLFVALSLQWRPNPKLPGQAASPRRARQQWKQKRVLSWGATLLSNYVHSCWGSCALVVFLEHLKTIPGTVECVWSCGCVLLTLLLGGGLSMWWSRIDAQLLSLHFTHRWAWGITLSVVSGASGGITDPPPASLPACMYFAHDVITQVCTHFLSK